MPLNQISHDELRAAHAQLDQALYSHQQWLNELTRVLVCRLRPDQRDLTAEAHRQCRFGQWYHEDAHPRLSEHPGFAAIGSEHERVHRLAARLLDATGANQPITANEYGLFTNAVERMRLEIHNLQHEIERLLFDRDPLTHAFSRAGLLPVLREQHELLKRHAQPCCIAMMDLDWFKRVNDEHGHPAGDRVLAASARYVMDSVRPYDRVFRYGGEEFLLCLQYASVPAAVDLVERLRAGLAGLDIDIGKDHPIRVTASFGLAALDPERPVEDMIDRADQALYAAKSDGRNRVRSWQPGT